MKWLRKMIDLDCCRCCFEHLVEGECFPLAKSEEIVSSIWDRDKNEPIKFQPEELLKGSMCQACWATLTEFCQWKDRIRQLRTERLMLPELPEPDDDEIISTPPAEDQIVTFKKVRQYEQRQARKNSVEHYQTNENGLYDCSHCPSAFKRLGRLLLHLENEHTFSDQNHLFLCQKCNTTFSDYKTLRKHHRDSHEAKKFKCDNCGKILATYQAVKNHIERIHLKVEVDKKTSPIACRICRKVLSSTSALAKHVKNFHQQTSELTFFNCNTCGDTFKSKWSLKAHEARHSEKTEDSTCPTCGKKLSSKYRLKTHMTAVHENTHNFTCHLCGKLFKEKQGLKLHLTTFHSENRPFRCQQCGKDFKSTQVLDVHVKRLHTDLPFIECPVCDKILKNEINLKVHMKIHNSRQTFFCATCGSQFRRKQDLRSHTRKVHLGFRCVVCSKVKSSRSKTIEHITKYHAEVLKSSYMERLIQTSSI